MSREYRWEVQPSEEIPPHFVLTTTDSVADAALAFESANGIRSIAFIRKVEIKEKIDYPDDFREVI